MAERGRRLPGVNQRRQVVMDDREVHDFLQSQQTLVVSTIHPNGSIHSVALWFAFLADEIVFETKTKSQKVQNIRRDPRMTIFAYDGTTYDRLRAVQLVGTGVIEEGPGKLWEIGLAVFERNNHPYSESDRPVVEAMMNKRVGIRFRPTHTVSWDHRKLGLTAADL